MQTISQIIKRQSCKLKYWVNIIFGSSDIFYNFNIIYPNFVATRNTQQKL
jgi:hypothetical protein